MHILSKYKDYYDYLSGIWGVDEKVVLDRTKFSPIKPNFDYNNLFKIDILNFYICGKHFQGLIVRDGIIQKVLYGEKMIPYLKFNERKKFYYIDKWSKEIFLDIIEDVENFNKKENCPILLDFGYKDLIHFPILSEFNVVDVLDAETIYLMLVEWLGKEDVIFSKLTDIQKIETHGFDKKTSFRNIK